MEIEIVKMEMVKIGPVELFPEEVEQYFREGKYIVTRTAIYKITRTAGKYRGKIVHRGKEMTLKGRFFAMDSKTVKDALGITLA